MDKVNCLVKNLAEVAHLVFDDVGVGVVAVEAEDSEFALQFLFEALGPCTLGQVEAAEHSERFY